MNSKNEKRIGFLLNVFAVIFLVIAGLLYFYLGPGEKVDSTEG